MCSFLEAFFWLQVGAAAEDMLCDSHFYKPKHVKLGSGIFFFFKVVLSCKAMFRSICSYLATENKVWKQIHGGHVGVRGKGELLSLSGVQTAFCLHCEHSFCPQTALPVSRKTSGIVSRKVLAETTVS